MTVHPRDIRKAAEQNGAEATAARAADEAEAGLAVLIGHAVAQALAPVLAQIATQPACVLCCAMAKQAEKAGAEQKPPIAQSMTVQPVQVGGGLQVPLPVCWAHFDTGPQERATGLVNPSGQPIIARSGQ